MLSFFILSIKTDLLPADMSKLSHSLSFYKMEGIFFSESEILGATSGHYEWLPDGVTALCLWKNLSRCLIWEGNLDEFVLTHIYIVAIPAHPPRCLFTHTCSPQGRAVSSHIRCDQAVMQGDTSVMPNNGIQPWLYSHSQSHRGISWIDIEHCGCKIKFKQKE